MSAGLEGRFLISPPQEIYGVVADEPGNCLSLEVGMGGHIYQISIEGWFRDIVQPPQVPLEQPWPRLHTYERNGEQRFTLDFGPPGVHVVPGRAALLLAEIHNPEPVTEEAAA